VDCLPRQEADGESKHALYPSDAKLSSQSMGQIEVIQQPDSFCYKTIGVVRVEAAESQVFWMGNVIPVCTK
jgi:hypothetical protein